MMKCLKKEKLSILLNLKPNSLYPIIGWKESNHFILNEILHIVIFI